MSSGSPLIRVNSWPSLHRPVLVMGLDGWIDAGFAATNAIATLLSATTGEPLATFDSDELIDHRARRPLVRIRDGVNSGLVWPEVNIRHAENSKGRSVLVLSGPEPDLRWHQFTEEVVGLASRLGVELVVGLGAFPAPVPHSRAVRLVSTASSAELATRVGFIPGGIDVPAGVQANLEHAFTQAGLETIGLWARVPHYVSAMPYPAASAALLDQLAALADLDIDTTTLHEASASTRVEIDRLITNSDEHAALVRQLENQADEEHLAAPMDFGIIPSGDELAAELERFLRGEGQPPQTSE
jgi:predicted ATP-grasp superfamily ATP-dependent carboligase